MLTKICQYLRNWFVNDMNTDILTDDFVISSGVLTYSDGTALSLLSGQYYRIVGSVLNDGVHCYGDESDTLSDESFSGGVWLMAVPPVIKDLAEEIQTWVTNNSAVIASPYQSESFGGYSYSLRGSSGSGGAAAGTWQSQFASELAPWRKI